MVYLTGLQKVSLEIENPTLKVVEFKRGEDIAKIQFLYNGLLQTLKNIRGGSKIPTDATDTIEKEEKTEAMARLDKENTEYENLRTQLPLWEIDEEVTSITQEQGDMRKGQKRKQETMTEGGYESPQFPERKRRKGVRPGQSGVELPRVELINRLLKSLQTLSQRSRRTRVLEDPVAYRRREKYQEREPYYTPLEAENAIAAGIMGLPCITLAQQQLKPRGRYTQAQLEQFRTYVLTEEGLRNSIDLTGLRNTYEKLFGQLIPTRIVEPDTPARRIARNYPDKD